VRHTFIVFDLYCYGDETDELHMVAEKDIV